MANTEQIVTDRKTMKELIEFMEEAVKEGLTKDEVMSQIDLILDKEAQKRLRPSEKDIKEKRIKCFKTPEDLLTDLHIPE